MGLYITITKLCHGYDWFSDPQWICGDQRDLMDQREPKVKLGNLVILPLSLGHVALMGILDPLDHLDPRDHVSVTFQTRTKPGAITKCHANKAFSYLYNNIKQ